MTAQGPRKGEPSSRSMRYGLWPKPAHLVRGSSRRIMTMRFRPANIRVINRRVCSGLSSALLSKNKTRSKPTSRNVFPLRRPSIGPWEPERCSQSRVRFAAPESGAPLTRARRSGRIVVAGGSGGTLRGPAHVKRQKAGFPPAEESRPENKKKPVRLGRCLTGRSILARVNRFETFPSGIY